MIGGEEQGKAILELFPDGAKIIELLGTPGASPAIDRSTGLHNVIDPPGTSRSSASRPASSTATRA